MEETSTKIIKKGFKLLCSSGYKMENGVGVAFACWIVEKIWVLGKWSLEAKHGREFPATVH